MCTSTNTSIIFDKEYIEDIIDRVRNDEYDDYDDYDEECFLNNE